MCSLAGCASVARRVTCELSSDSCPCVDVDPRCMATVSVARCRSALYASSNILATLFPAARRHIIADPSSVCPSVARQPVVASRPQPRLKRQSKTDLKFSNSFRVSGIRAIVILATSGHELHTKSRSLTWPDQASKAPSASPQRDSHFNNLPSHTFPSSAETHHSSPQEPAQADPFSVLPSVACSSQTKPDK